MDVSMHSMFGEVLAIEIVNLAMMLQSWWEKRKLKRLGRTSWFQRLTDGLVKDLPVGENSEGGKRQ